MEAKSYSNASSAADFCLVLSTGNPLNGLSTSAALHLGISLTFTTSCFALEIFVYLFYFHYTAEKPETVLS